MFDKTILILLITVGIPVLSLTLIILKGMDNRKEKKQHEELNNLSESELRDIYYGLKDINRRIENLETILYHKNDTSPKN